MNSPEAAPAFLQALYGENAPGSLVLWTRQDKRSYWIPAVRLDDAAQLAPQLATSKDVHFCVGLQREALDAHHRGTAESVIALPGLWGDFDIKGPAHKGEDLPPTIEAVWELLKEFPLPPTTIVHSGHGLQAWWLFKELWVFASEEERQKAQELSRRFQATLQVKARVHGWRIDNTSDLARVLRLPGTFNHKLEPVRVQVIEEHPECRYDISDFEPYLLEIPPTENTSPREWHGPTGNLTPVLANCRFIQHCSDHATNLSEPFWWAMVSNLARLEGGREAIHALSAPYPKYSQAETEQKIEHVLAGPGPHTCDYIQQSSGFAGCPPGGCGVKAPAALGVSQYDPAGKTKSRALESVPLTSDLILEVAGLLRRHVFFKDKRLSLFIAVWSLAGYVYDIFTFFGYLWINSPVKRCGKSLLEDVLSHICRLATPRLSNVSESSVFRLANEGHTLILDELENLRAEDREKYGTVMSILNSGFQAGGKVPRVEKSKSGFQVVYYNAFCPKVLAGIRHLADTIEDRSFKIPMVRKMKAEKVERFNLRKQAGELAALREEMEVWAEARRGDVETIYDGIGEIRELAEADDRFKDIAEPLLAIASFADAEATDGQKRVLPDLLPLLLSLAGKRAESEWRESIAAFVPVAEEVLAAEEKVFIRSDDLLEKVKQIEELVWIGSTTALGNFLRKFDLSPRRDPAGKFRGYLVTRSWLEEVKSRYSSIPPGFNPSDMSETAPVVA